MASNVANRDDATMVKFEPTSMTSAATNHGTLQVGPTSSVRSNSDSMQQELLPITKGLNPDTRCLFLSLLPAELRNRIYEHALTEPRSIIIDLYHEVNYRISANQPALTCQIRVESLGMFYELNTFRFTTHELWVRKLEFNANSQGRYFSLRLDLSKAITNYKRIIIDGDGNFVDEVGLTYFDGHRLLQADKLLRKWTSGANLHQQLTRDMFEKLFHIMQRP